MRFHRFLPVLLSLSLFTPAFVSARDVQIQFRWGSREHRLEGHRYRTMRALAHYLDERADHAAEQAAESSRRGNRNERKFVDSVTHFAEQARAFHERMDRYADAPWEVPDQVDHLNDDARQVSERIRRAHVFEQTWDDWDAVVDVLDRMNRLLAGQDVQVPAAHRPGWRDYDDDYGPGRNH